MSSKPMVRHRLIVRHPSCAQVLLDAGRLPQVVTEEQHTAEVDFINAAAARFGVRTVVLRSLWHSDGAEGVVERVLELEAFDDGPLSSSALCWCPITSAELLENEPDKWAIRQFLAESGAVVVDGREWTRPGWFAATSAWIVSALALAGLGQPEEIIQLRAWSTSTVLRVVTLAGDYYFKAVPKSGRQEVALTSYLAEHFPDVVSDVIAADLERGWLLLASCRGRKLEQVADMALWERAATRYGRLQVDCVGRADALRALGCPSRDLAALASSIAELALDTGALGPERSEGLTETELRRFRAQVPKLGQRCEELAACGIPDSLEHGDLWPGNVICDAETCAVIDWEDALIAHPFFSLAPLTAGLVGAGLGTAENVVRLQRAYAVGFESLAPPNRLRRAMELALPLSFLDMAARYRRQRPSIVRQHPWMRELVPRTIRLALSHLA